GDFVSATRRVPYDPPGDIGFYAADVEPTYRDAKWLAAIGRFDEARDLLNQLERHVDHFGSAATLGLLLSARGVVERDADLARRGADVLAATEFRFAHAEAMIEVGKLLRR